MEEGCGIIDMGLHYRIQVHLMIIYWVLCILIGTLLA